MIDRLRSAFPLADILSADASEYGFAHGVVVGNGQRVHAISLSGRTLEGAIATLRKWGAR